jgi:hypothetical protein
MGIRRECVHTTNSRKTWQWWPPVLLTRNWAGHPQRVSSLWHISHWHWSPLWRNWVGRLWTLINLSVDQTMKMYPTFWFIFSIEPIIWNMTQARCYIQVHTANNKSKRFHFFSPSLQAADIIDSAPGLLWEWPVHWIHVLRHSFTRMRTVSVLDLFHWA